jgi:hypothetical protein
LIWVLPDGFSALFRPAAALPGPLLMPVLPVALPVVVPVAGDPVVVPLAAVPPVAELPPVAPPVDCANAEVPVKISAVAKPNVVSFMIDPFLAVQGKRAPRVLRSNSSITVRCCSHEDFRNAQLKSKSMRRSALCDSAT